MPCKHLKMLFESSLFASSNDLIRTFCWLSFVYSFSILELTQSYYIAKRPVPKNTKSRQPLLVKKMVTPSNEVKESIDSGSNIFYNKSTKSYNIFGPTLQLTINNVSNLCRNFQPTSSFSRIKEIFV